MQPLNEGGKEHANSLENNLRGVECSLGDKDYISHLPDLCLLQIFRFLKKRDLFNVMLASRRLGSLTSCHGLDRWDGGILTLVQIERGFGFEIGIASDEYPFNTDREMTSYQYTIEWNEEEKGFVEKRTRNGNPLRGCGSPVDFPIPSPFFANLKEILREHEARIIVIDKFRFDGLLFSLLLPLFTGHRVDRLILSGVVSQGITDDQRRSFTQFINALGVKDLNLEFSPSLNALLTEQFLKKLRLTDLYTNTNLKEAQTHLFRAEQSMIPILTLYSNLESSCVIVHADWVITLIIEHMKTVEESVDCSSTWFLALEGNLTHFTIDYQLRGSGYTHQRGGLLMSESTSTMAVLHSTQRDDRKFIRVQFSRKNPPKYSPLW
ncbi:hypothetical protein PMAYCL1PPCAC_18921 [Pristionchus mayeri]|uniref:F-box domain-containing protein n=1 Tax=Pristionchus mayeri TaxID=1317129 RepID=A0AAN5CQD1_9BILA|nr:hypothetical protein PMAYCL1PPCAC_18921 [Pristionchus mayeri]